MIKFSCHALEGILTDYGEDDLAAEALSLDQATIDAIGEIAMDLAVKGMRIEKAILHGATRVLASREPARKRRISKKRSSN